MDIDEAIKHEKEVAEKYHREAIEADANGFGGRAKMCRRCAGDHLQMKVWLRELKRLRNQERPRGEWLSHYDYCKKHECIPSGLIAFWWCNQCEQGVEHPTNFCPNCGAPMTEEALKKYNGLKEGDKNG